MEESKIYEQIARVIEAANSNFKGRLNLAELAEQLNSSQERLELLFKEFASVSVDEFFRSLSIGHARNLLKSGEKTLFSDAEGPEVDSPFLCTTIEQMTYSDCKNGGANLVINYSFSSSHFGNLLLASTKKGLCDLAFYDEKSVALKLLNAKFPRANFQQQSDLFQEQALLAFRTELAQQQTIQLHLKGTQFQLKVWNQLLKIPMGKLSTYGEIAKAFGNPNASRAVGTAIGLNPIAFLIPCHRVIQASGNFGGYMWGMTRKKAIVGWELSMIRNE